jgi:hypothetical protein
MVAGAVAFSPIGSRRRRRPNRRAAGSPLPPATTRSQQQRFHRSVSLPGVGACPLANPGRNPSPDPGSQFPPIVLFWTKSTGGGGRTFRTVERARSQRYLPRLVGGALSRSERGGFSCCRGREERGHGWVSPPQLCLCCVSSLVANSTWATWNCDGTAGLGGCQPSTNLPSPPSVPLLTGSAAESRQPWHKASHAGGHRTAAACLKPPVAAETGRDGKQTSTPPQPGRRGR